jgi:sucrose phosphorylase
LRRGGDDPVARDPGPEDAAVADATLQRGEVHMHDPEPVRVPVRPFEVVEQRPHEVAAQIDAGLQRPARGILSNEEIDLLVDKALEHGGLISFKHNADGSQSPYEMNINYFNALSNPNGDEPLGMQVDRFIAAQAIMLALPGIPGIYFHSLFGSRGWIEGVKQTGRNRTINREKLQFDELQNELADENSLRSNVFTRYCQLLKARSSTPAFHPHGTQKILKVHPSVFAIERISPDKKVYVVCLHNVSPQKITFATDYRLATDLFTGQDVDISKIVLGPYQILWLKIN